MVSIIAPVNSLKEVNPIISAGASELYCGVIDESWNRKYSSICAPNRREWRQSNLKSFQELSSVVREAHKKGVPVSLALNAPYFTQRQEKHLKSYVKKAVSCGVDSLMVADVGLFLLLKELSFDVEVHVSSVAGVLNSQAVSFYKKLGAERVILPRHLTLSEIHSIVKSRKDVKFEVFILFNRCLFSDCLCTFLHGDKTYGLGENACTMQYDIQAIPRNKNTRENIRKLDSAYHTTAGVTQNLSFQCGLCALYDLSKWGVYGVKVVERGKPLWMKKQGVYMLSKIIRHLKEDKLGKQDFIRDVKSIVEKTVFSDKLRPCGSFNCFFPELL